MPEHFENEREIYQLCQCLCGKYKHYSSGEWEKIIKQAITHRVAPLLYSCIRTLPHTFSLPAIYLEQLHHLFLGNVARNTYLFTGLTRIIKTLQQEQIEVIILKGGSLEATVYGNKGLRVMSDIDLLVKHDNLTKSQRLLQQAGNFSDLPPFPLDMHWHLDLSIADLNISMSEVWERAEPVIFADVEARSLCPEDLLIHLCMHQAFHHSFQFAPVRTLWDIRAVVHHYEQRINWEQVLTSAEKWGVHHAVFVTFSLAKELLEADIPAHVLHTIRPEAASPHIQAWAREQMMSEPLETIAYSPYFWQLFAPGSFLEKLKSLKLLVFPPAEFVSQKYPAAFRTPRNYLDYIIRLKEHARPYINALWRILRHDPIMLHTLKQQRQNIIMRRRLLSQKK